MADEAPLTPEQLERLNKLKAKYGTSPGLLGNIATGMGMQQQAYAGGPEAEMRKEVGSVMYPGIEDLSTGVGLAEMRVAAPIVARTLGGSTPLGRAIGAGVSVLAGVGAKQLTEAGAELVSNTGVRDVTNAFRGEVRPELVDKTTETLFAPPFKSAATLVVGNRLEAAANKGMDLIAPAVKKMISNKLSYGGAAQALRAHNLPLSSLKKKELIPEKTLTSPVVQAFQEVAGLGIDTTAHVKTLKEQLLARKAELGPLLREGFKAADTQLAQEAYALGVPVENLIEDRIREKAEAFRRELIAKQQTPDIIVFNEVLDDAFLDLQNTITAARGVTPDYQFSIGDLNSLKSSLYSGAKYETNAAGKKVAASRAVGRLFKETIEDLTPNADVAQLNKMYGALDEVDSVLDTPWARYVRGEQSTLQSTFINALTTGSVAYGAAKFGSEGADSNTAVAAMIGAPIVAAGLSRLPLVRSFQSKMLQGLSRGTSGPSLAPHIPAAYAANRIINELAINTAYAAAQTEIPRSSKTLADKEVTAPRIAKTLMDSGLDPQSAYEVALGLSDRLSSPNPIEREGALMEMAGTPLLSPALSQDSSGFNIIDNRFINPMEQSHYLRSAIGSSKSVKDEMEAIVPALHGKIREDDDTEEEELNTQRMTEEPSIDFEMLDGAFQLSPDYSQDMSSEVMSYPSIQDPVKKLEALSKEPEY